MPEISRFYGIVIKMFFDDHFPEHFHVEYGEYKAVIDLGTLEVIKGQFPNKQLRLVQAWAIIHENEISDIFNKLKTDPESWYKVEPLK